jgi:DNA-binding LytR/AlgR family response regulator
VIDRLPQGLSGDIVYLKTDGHYVKVHTTAGSCMMLMRFRDAVADLGDLGMQVHRCYWVAHRHVLATVRRDTLTLLRVTGDHRVPVSRSHLQPVRAAIARSREGPPAGTY